MKISRLSALVYLAAGLLAAGGASQALWAKAQSATASPQSQTQDSKSIAKKPLDAQMKELNDSAEQISREARNLQENLQKDLAGLEKQISSGDFMKPDDAAKLRTFAEKFGSDRDALESRAEALSAQAEELASKGQEEAGKAVDQMAVRVQNSPYMIDFGDENTGWLGLQINEVTPDNAKELKLPAVRGVVVQEVEPNSPAAKAGLKEKDVITQFDGQVVEGTVQFRRLVRETPPGRMVPMTVVRDGQEQTLSAEVGDASALYRVQLREGDEAFPLPMPEVRAFALTPDVADRATPKLGIEAEDLSGQLGAYFGAPGGTGILVRDVRPGTPADKAGLKAGDVITQIDAKPVKTLGELRAELGTKADQKSVSLSVLRKGSALSLPVAIEKPQPAERQGAIRRAQM